MNEFPFVTAMIVVRNEENYIEKCFRSLLEQSYPPDRYEVLIIDGMSDDETLSIAKETEKKYAYRVIPNGDKVKVQVHYLHNQKRILAAGWNLGIKNAEGEYVIRIDAHGYADKDFILKSVETMLNVGDAVCVGGPIQTKAISKTGEVISHVLSSPFGVGNSEFRYSKKPQYVDTVAFGLYKKSVFNEIGYFDETLKRNQDNDLHRRIKENGGRFYLNPEIKSFYFSRETVKEMMKQGYQNGKWNIVTFRINKKSLSWRHLVPFCFVIGIIGCGFLGVFYSVFWQMLLVALIIHLLLGFMFSLRKTNKITYVLKMPWLFMMLHLSYGTGSLLSFMNLTKM